MNREIRISCSRRKLMLLIAGWPLLGAARTAGAQEEMQPPPPGETVQTTLVLREDLQQLRGIRPDRRQWEEAARILQARLALLTGTARLELRADSVLLTVEGPQVDSLRSEYLIRPLRLRLYELKDMLPGRDGRTRFELEQNSSTSEVGAPAQTYSVRERRTGRLIPLSEYLSKCRVIVEPTELSNATVVSADGLPAAVRVELNKKATERLEKVSSGRATLLALLLDDRVVTLQATTPRPKPARRKKDEEEAETAPLVIDLIGPFRAPEEISFLATGLRSGPLPFAMRIASREVQRPVPPAAP